MTIDDHNMRQDRPYDGQPWTGSGERGKTEISGVTFRDLQDCFIRAVLLSASDQNETGYREAQKGELAALAKADMYELDWNKISPMAVCQNLSCEIGRVMGIFPNIADK